MCLVKVKSISQSLWLFYRCKGRCLLKSWNLVSIIEILILKQEKENFWLCYVTLSSQTEIIRLSDNQPICLIETFHTQWRQHKVFTETRGCNKRKNFYMHHHSWMDEQMGRWTDEWTIQAAILQLHIVFILSNNRTWVTFLKNSCFI